MNRECVKYIEDKQRIEVFFVTTAVSLKRMSFYSYERLEEGNVYTVWYWTDIEGQLAVQCVVCVDDSFRGSHRDEDIEEYHYRAGILERKKIWMDYPF